MCPFCVSQLCRESVNLFGRFWCVNACDLWKERKEKEGIGSLRQTASAGETLPGEFWSVQPTVVELRTFELEDVIISRTH